MPKKKPNKPVKSKSTTVTNPNAARIAGVRSTPLGEHTGKLPGRLRQITNGPNVIVTNSRAMGRSPIAALDPQMAQRPAPQNGGNDA